MGPSENFHGFTRLTLARALGSIGAGGFYGFFFALAGKYIFHLPEDINVFLVWLPFSVIFAIAVFVKSRVAFTDFQQRRQSERMANHKADKESTR